MADPKGTKRKRETGDEFVHIRAKGQFLKVPITLEHGNKQDVTVRGMFYRQLWRTFTIKVVRLTAVHG